MKDIKDYINEEKNTTGGGCVEMIKTIFSELSKHSDCKYDKEKNAFVGKDADLWKGAGQFLYDYCNELSQSDLKKIVNAMGWESYIPDVNDIHPSEISMCMSLELSK